MLVVLFKGLKGNHVSPYKLGDEKYKAQSRLEKEEYVYDELMKNHKEQLTDYQISGARKYLDEVREEHMKEIAKKLK